MNKVFTGFIAALLSFGIVGSTIQTADAGKRERRIAAGIALGILGAAIIADRGHAKRHYKRKRQYRHRRYGHRHYGHYHRHYRPHRHYKKRRYVRKHRHYRRHHRAHNRYQQRRIHRWGSGIYR